MHPMSFECCSISSDKVCRRNRGDYANEAVNLSSHHWDKPDRGCSIASGDQSLGQSVVVNRKVHC